MKFKTSITFMVAIVLALVTAKVGMDYLKTHGGRGGTGARVVVASRDMEPGYVIQAADIVLKEVPLSMVTAKTMRDSKEVVGRTVLSNVGANYPLTEGVLSPAGSGAGMVNLIPPGFRLVTVDVSESSGVAGLITPGCRVDVIATLRDGDQSLAKSIVQNVKVQFVQRGRVSSSSGRVNSSAAPDAGPVKTVSLLVTLEQAVKIELANSEGKPRLILRGNGEETAESDPSINKNKLLGLPDPPPKAEAPPTPIDVFEPPPAEPKPGFTFEMIRGGVKSKESLDQEGTKEEGNSGATPTASGKGKKVAGEARNESGVAPDGAPRKDAGRGNLR
jgi:pilus assembly protein CpaB